MANFVDEFGVGAFDHLADSEGSVWEQFGIITQPAFAFVNDDGTVEVVQGALGESALFERTEALL